MRVGVTVKSRHLGGSNLKIICVKSEIEAESGVGGVFVVWADDELVELFVFDEEELLLVWFVFEEFDIELTVTLFPLAVPLADPLIDPLGV